MIVDAKKRIAVGEAPVAALGEPLGRWWTVYPTLESYEEDIAYEKLGKQTYQDMFEEAMKWQNE